LADAVWFTKERREALVIFFVDSKDLAESTMMFRFADLDTYIIDFVIRAGCSRKEKPCAQLKHGMDC